MLITQVPPGAINRLNRLMRLRDAVVAMPPGGRRSKAMEGAVLAQKKYTRRVEGITRAARVPKTNEALVAGVLSSLSRIETLLANLLDVVRWQVNTPSRTRRRVLVDHSSRITSTPSITPPLTTLIRTMEATMTMMLARVVLRMRSHPSRRPASAVVPMLTLGMTTKTSLAAVAGGIVPALQKLRLVVVALVAPLAKPLRHQCPSLATSETSSKERLLLTIKRQSKQKSMS